MREQMAKVVTGRKRVQNTRKMVNEKPPVKPVLKQYISPILIKNVVQETSLLQ